ncbi:MAG: DUF6544 family protein [Halobacteria archaeon]|nr:DUF6544 family protein [Halobacteria archaeon]
MGFKSVLKVVVVLTLGIVSAVLVAKFRLERKKDRLVEDLLGNADAEPDRVFTKDDLNGLPDPVREYLSSVLTEGRPYVRTVCLKQSGELRLGDENWKPFTATQHFTVDPPGFIWDAKIKVAPLVPVRVLDMYKNGEGSLQGKLLSLFTVAKAKPSPGMSSGELIRYLGERIWFPTSLLPSEGVEWEPIDDSSARATLEHKGTTASAVFHFNDRNEVERVVSEGRYRQEEDGFEPWTGYFRDYEERNGMLVPLDAEAEWNMPDGDLPYWRGSVEEIEHRP